MANHPKLNSDQISEMKRLYSEGDKQADLAKRYEVSITTIRNKLGLGKAKEEEEEAYAPGGMYLRPEMKTAADIAFNSSPEELGQAAVEAVKKKEPPKRRIVGVNV